MKTSLCCLSNTIHLQNLLNNLFILNYFSNFTACIAKRTLISDRHLSAAEVWNHGMLPSMILRILCVACWLYAELQRCCANDKLKEEQTERMIKCSKTCAHLAKNLVGTQPVYEVRNAIWGHFSFTWIGEAASSHPITRLYCCYIILLWSRLSSELSWLLCNYVVVEGSLLN